MIKSSREALHDCSRFHASASLSMRLMQLRFGSGGELLSGSGGGGGGGLPAYSAAPPASQVGMQIACRAWDHFRKVGGRCSTFDACASRRSCFGHRLHTDSAGSSKHQTNGSQLAAGWGLRAAQIR